MFQEMIDAFKGMSKEEIIKAIDAKISSCDPKDAKGIANLKALKQGFIIGYQEKK